MHLAVVNQPRAVLEANRLHESPNPNPSTYALSMAYHARCGLDARIACNLYRTFSAEKQSYPQSAGLCSGMCKRAAPVTAVIDFQAEHCGLMLATLVLIA